MLKIVQQFQDWLNSHGISPSQVTITLDVLTESGSYRLSQEISKELASEFAIVPEKGTFSSDRQGQYKFGLSGMNVIVRKLAPPRKTA